MILFDEVVDKIKTSSTAKQITNSPPTYKTCCLARLFVSSEGGIKSNERRLSNRDVVVWTFSPTSKVCCCYMCRAIIENNILLF